MQHYTAICFIFVSSLYTNTHTMTQSVHDL